MTHEAGVTLGIPLGGVEGDDAGPEDFLRIGHMGHVNAHMVLGVLASLQAGMTALGIPHGATGLEAAMRVIAEG
jgi:alanine-glyoxylate transaminase/serine-glyoxylate transaminase/serine-pyruvate transaminase